MAKRISIFLLGLGVLILFVFFSYLVHKDIFTQFDFDTTVKLQDNISRRFDEPFSFLSDIGSFEPATIFLLILLVIYRKVRGIFVLFFFAAFHIIEVFGKTFVEHLPPPEFLLRAEKIIELPRFHVRNEFSYPSGHAGRAAFITVLIALMLLKTKKLSSTHKLFIISGLVMYDLIMFVSRAYLGEHWISDVFGGALLGAAMGIISWAFIS